MNDKAKKDVCFIVSPIGAKGSEPRTHADWVFKGIIEPVFKAYPNFHIERSDHISTPGQINAQVIDRLLNARLVIADLSMLNPNVFYEIGIRHMVEKPIIHLQREDDPIPFDVAIYRAIKFSLKEYTDLEAAQGLLARMIEDVLAPEYVTNNPVTEARGRVKLKESATPEQQILLEDMASMKSRLAHLETMQNLQGMMVDPTISISNRISDDAERSRQYAIRRVAKAMIGTGETATVSVDTRNMSPALVLEIVKMIKNAGRPITSLGIGEGEAGIEVDGPLSDMMSLRDMLEHEEQIGPRRVAIERH